VSDFTGGAIEALPEKAHSTGNPDLDRRVCELVRDSGCNKSQSLIKELIVTALSIGKENLSTADLKLFNRALRELHEAARMFAPYADKKKVVIFGSARTPPHELEFQMAETFAARMVKHGYMIITGGGEGIMGAAQRGAGRKSSFGLNIRLPFEQQANEIIHGDSKLLNFNYFFTRKLNFLKESHAVVLFPGGFGTLDEGFESLTLMQTGKARIMPLILVDKPDGEYWNTWKHFFSGHLLRLGLVSADDENLVKITTDVDVAIQEIEQFYRNFHSYRWVGNRLVIRIKKQITQEAANELSVEFDDILLRGKIRLSAALRAERNEPALADLPRLILTPHRHNFGRIRLLIDGINRAETIE
jgi:uncharacterized protein (TIGR00730 family)